MWDVRAGRPENIHTFVHSQQKYVVKSTRFTLSQFILFFCDKAEQNNCGSADKVHQDGH